MISETEMGGPAPSAKAGAGIALPPAAGASPADAMLPPNSKDSPASESGTTKSPSREIAAPVPRVNGNINSANVTNTIVCTAQLKIQARTSFQGTSRVPTLRDTPPRDDAGRKIADRDDAGGLGGCGGLSMTVSGPKRLLGESDFPASL
ncbi:MAG: hypothetical protein ACK5OB_18030 [Pirellula sp.]|jgi:hypothetical protein